MSNVVLNTSPFCPGQKPFKHQVHILSQKKPQGILYFLYTWPKQAVGPNVSIQNDSFVSFEISSLKNCNVQLAPFGAAAFVFSTDMDQFVVVPPPNVSFENFESNNLTLQIANANQSLSYATITPTNVTPVFPNTFDATNFGCGWYHMSLKSLNPGTPDNNFFFKIQNVNTSKPTITFQPGSDVGNGQRNFYLPFNFLNRNPLTLQLTASTTINPTRVFRFAPVTWYIPAPPVPLFAENMIVGKVSETEPSGFKIQIVPQHISQGKYKYKLFDFELRTVGIPSGYISGNITVTQRFEHPITFDQNGIANGILVDDVYQSC